MEKYMHKDAEISIAFADPVLLAGKIVNDDGDFLEIELDEKQTGGYYKNTSGKMLLNKKYLISVVLK